MNSSEFNDRRTITGRPGAERHRRQYLTWAPVPIFMGAIALVQALQPGFRQESQALVSVLYTLFCASPAIIVAFLAGQTFLAVGSARMLLLGLGAVFFGAIYLVSAMLLPDYNAGVTVNNFGFLLSGLCFLGSGLMPGRPEGESGRQRWPVLALAYATALAGMVAWIWAAYNGLLPRFYVPGVGHTGFRNIILALGLAAFVGTALRYALLHFRTGAQFERWFGQSIAIIAIAMVAALLISAGGTTMAWLARIALCVGGIYMFLSILSAVQESGAWRIPLERALHQHQALYRAALESISDSFLAMDSEFRLTYINKRALGYGGACAEEVLGRTLWEAFPTILGTPLEEFYRKAMAARQPMTYTNPSVVARGHHFELHAYPAEDGLTVFGRDITERKRAEEALRDAEREKSLILDNANEIIAYHDCANNLIWANKAYLASTSLPLADLKGRKCYSCWGLDRLCENCPVVTAIRTGQPQEAELTPQDQPHWPADQGSWLVRAAPVRDDAGNVVGAIEVAHDITARKKAEAELAAAHRLMQDLIDNTTSMIFVCDLEERFVLANAPLVALLKTTQAQLIGKRRHEFMPQADADAHEAHDRKVIAAGRPVEFEESSELNGRSITWLSMKFPLRDAQGRIYGVAGIVTDISERKRAEEQLRESEEKLRSVMESMSEGVVVFDATGKITYQNPASVQIHSNKLFGERQRFDSLTVHWEVRTYPDGSLVPSERWAIPRILRGESIHSEQFFVDCVDDPERSFIGAYSGSPIYGSREKIVSGFLTIRDITQQKQAEDALRASEERFRQVVETLPQLVWTCRADGPCDYLSPQWVSYTGIPQAEQLGYRWLEQLHPDDRQRAVDQWQATATLGKTFVTEFRIRRHDGIYRWFRTLAVPLRDDGGRVVKWFGTNTDIQDIRELAAIATQAHAFGLSFRQPPQRPATDSGSVTFGVPER